jgi:hypothetical protein
VKLILQGGLRPIGEVPVERAFFREVETDGLGLELPGQRPLFVGEVPKGNSIPVFLGEFSLDVTVFDVAKDSLMSLSLDCVVEVRVLVIQCVRGFLGF